MTMALYGWYIPGELQQGMAHNSTEGPQLMIPPITAVIQVINAKPYTNAEGTTRITNYFCPIRTESRLDCNADAGRSKVGKPATRPCSNP